MKICTKITGKHVKLTDMFSHTHTHTQTHTQTHAQTHTPTDTRTHARTHGHSQMTEGEVSLSLSLSLSVYLSLSLSLYTVFYFEAGSSRWFTVIKAVSYERFWVWSFGIISVCILLD